MTERVNDRIEQVCSVRRLDRSAVTEIELVAQRMRATLEEVLGVERGRTMYTMDWLINRVRQHLEGDLAGAVLVAEDAAGTMRGHTIVRIDEGRDGAALGLFSTIYVVPAYRRQAIAARLIQGGEAWMIERGVRTFATYTSATNEKLIHLFRNYGYAVVEQIVEKEMVIIAKRIAL